MDNSGWPGDLIERAQGTYTDRGRTCKPSCCEMAVLTPAAQCYQNKSSQIIYLKNPLWESLQTVTNQDDS